jgi:hypothetical protein
LDALADRRPVNIGSMSESDLLHADITSRIIKAFYRVYDALGYGFLENVYCGALEIEFCELQLRYLREAPIDAFLPRTPSGLLPR